MLKTQQKGLVDFCQTHLWENRSPLAHSLMVYLELIVTSVAVPNSWLYSYPFCGCPCFHEWLLQIIVLFPHVTSMLFGFSLLKLMQYNFFLKKTETLHNIFRYHFSYSVVAQASCAKSDILCGNLKHEHWGYELNGNIGEFSVLPKIFSHGPSFSTMPSLGIENLSSQAGARTSDNEVDDGFSDLDSPLETNKIGTMVDKDDDEFISEQEISGDELEVDSAEVADSSLGLSDRETQSNDKKEPRRKSLTSPLFKIVMEAPRHSVTAALNKWVEEGNSLGRDDISSMLWNLRKRRFYQKALQVLASFLSKILIRTFFRCIKYMIAPRHENYMDCACWLF